MKGKRLSEDEIQVYHPIVVFEIWAFTIILLIIAVSGLFLLRDWLFLTFGVYGSVYIPTPEGMRNIHIWFGFALAVLGFFHLVIHLPSKKKDILSIQTLRDFKAFLHSGMYLIGFTRREDRWTTERFNGRQRIVYLALVYILGLTILPGLNENYWSFETWKTVMGKFQLQLKQQSGIISLFGEVSREEYGTDSTIPYGQFLDLRYWIESK